MANEVAPWQVRDNDDDNELRLLLEQDRIWNCFALADLLPPMRDSTRFVTASRPGNSPSALLLIVQHPEIQVISPFGDAAGVAAILANARLPERTLVQTTAAHRPLLEAVYRPVPAWRAMQRMAVNAQTFVPVPADARVERLTAEESAEVTDLYRLFPEGHFRPELLAQGSYHGLRVDGRLVAIAGTHVVVEKYGIAVVGGVFTHPDARGKGYARSVTSAVVSHLLGRGCRDVVLNVFAENAPAIAVYHRLGFQTAHQMWTGQAERRQGGDAVNDASPAIAAIVLAAGKSSRMGANKLLLPLDGHPLVWHAVQTACASSADVVLVVLGNEAERVAAALPPGRYQRVDNPRFADGLSTSLRAGLDALPENVDGALILLADMPFTASATVEALLAAAREAPDRIAAMNQRGRPTPPVYWPRALFGELHNIHGDEGGRSLLMRSPDAVHLVATAQSDEALDVDAPEDYQRIVGRRAGG